jgi:SAM domain (Sterile alpha motif)
MQEIADWLTRLGLPECAGAFAENGIDVSVLPHLTDQELKDVGVLLGHRRKILAAVAELPGKSPSASKPFPPLVEARDRHRPNLANRRRSRRHQPKPWGSAGTSR